MWMSERQSVESRKLAVEKKNGAGGNGSDHLETRPVFGGLIGTEIWTRAADSACGEVSATLESSGLAVRGLCEMQTQWWSFLERTLRSSLDASQQLRDCRDYQQVVHHQGRFIEERVRDLVAESTAMFRLSSRVAAESIEPFTVRWSSAKSASEG
jgi:hypothetical protein